eukprot:Opistho-2@73464
MDDSDSEYASCVENLSDDDDDSCIPIPIVNTAVLDDVSPSPNVVVSKGDVSNNLLQSDASTNSVVESEPAVCVLESAKESEVSAAENEATVAESTECDVVRTIGDGDMSAAVPHTTVEASAFAGAAALSEPALDAASGAGFDDSNSGEMEHADPEPAPVEASAVFLSEDEIKERLACANAAKEEGNKHFTAGEYGEAIRCYTLCIERCPPKHAAGAVFYSNRAACYSKQDAFELVVDDCTTALDLDPSYVKARVRRGHAYEKLDKLEEALADFNLVLEADPGNYVARDATRRLPPLITEKQEKLKAEMIGKLKDLGNLVLGKFGLSTDNFQLQQDPATGSYSVNFTR